MRTLSFREARALGLIGKDDAPRSGTRRRSPRRPRGTLRPMELVLERDADTLHLVLPTPPRPKKNNTRVVWTRKGPRQVQTPAFYRFAADVCAAIMPSRVALGLPLPHGRYHIRATFYCDNALSDLKNLEAGLADVLELAGVVENDQQLEAWDGSRRYVDKARPRVEIVIAPLVE